MVHGYTTIWNWHFHILFYIKQNNLSTTSIDLLNLFPLTSKFVNPNPDIKSNSDSLDAISNVTINIALEGQGLCWFNWYISQSHGNVSPYGAVVPPFTDLCLRHHRGLETPSHRWRIPECGRSNILLFTTIQWLWNPKKLCFRAVTISEWFKVTEEFNDLSMSRCQVYSPLFFNMAKEEQERWIKPK